MYLVVLTIAEQDEMLTVIPVLGKLRQEDHMFKA